MIDSYASTTNKKGSKRDIVEKFDDKPDMKDVCWNFNYTKYKCFSYALKILKTGLLSVIMMYSMYNMNDVHAEIYFLFLSWFWKGSRQVIA
jgi:hypothetical protein